MLNICKLLICLSIFSSCSLFNLRFKTVTPQNEFKKILHQDLFGRWESTQVTPGTQTYSDENFIAQLDIKCTGHFDLKVFKNDELVESNLGGHIGQLDTNKNIIIVKTLVLYTRYKYTNKSNMLTISNQSLPFFDSKIDLKRVSSPKCSYVP